MNSDSPKQRGALVEPSEVYEGRGGGHGQHKDKQFLGIAPHLDSFPGWINVGG